MTEYRVELTRRAERDVDEIVSWLAARSTRGARTWLDRLADVLATLSTTAGNCSLAPEDGHGDTEIRQLIFKTRRGKPYRMLFTILGGVVFVRHVRGPGQGLVPPEKLNQPFE